MPLQSTIGEPYPNPIRLSLTGVNSEHGSGYTVERQTGSDEYLFEFFDSPVVLQDEQGRHAYSGNVFILYAPGQPQYFRAEGPLTHTWFQVTGEGMAECIQQYRIPVNQATEITHPDFLTPLLKDALRATVRKHRHWEDAVTETLKTLFRRLARVLYETGPVELTPYQKQVLATLYWVRAQVYKELRRRWTVEDMADLASMSAPRFAVTYRSHFGTGPIDDLIDVRLRHTATLLQHLPITVVEAAQHFGFNTGSNFHVLFRERMGHSPRAQSRITDRPSTYVFDPENLLGGSEAARRINLLYISPTGHWSFDQIDTAVVDDLGKHPQAILQNNVTRIAGRHEGYALHFDGSSHAVIPETVIDTSQSYTICAWLTYDRTERMTAISIGNSHHGAFYLQYVPAEGGFKFAVTISERDPLAIYVVSDTAPAPGDWYQVVGVHDCEKKEILLYVNGKWEGRTEHKTPWRADGSTYLGCCQVMDTNIDHWSGSLDDVRIYDRALSLAEIELLYRGEKR